MLGRINHSAGLNAARAIARAGSCFLAVSLIGSHFYCSIAHAASSAVAQFQKEIQPLLSQYCYDCHGDGEKKGNVAFDELKSDDAILNHDLWLKVLKNRRAGLMPPAKKPRPSAEEQEKLERWIKYGAFAIDPKNPDPGR